MDLVHRIAAAVLGGAAVSLVAGCGEREPTPPRSLDEIFQERSQLPKLYLTKQSNRRVVMGGGEYVFIDEQTGELCFPAQVCNRSDCPSRGADGEPFIFSAPDPIYYIDDDGKVAIDATLFVHAPPMLGHCPKCLEQRDLESETDEQRHQYGLWVSEYVLPESAARLVELDQERRRRVHLDRHQRIAGTAPEESEDDGS